MLKKFNKIDKTSFFIFVPAIVMLIFMVIVSIWNFGHQDKEIQDPKKAFAED